MTEHSEIQWRATTILFEIRRVEDRTMVVLDIDADGQLIVTAPTRISVAELNFAVRQKADWIVARLTPKAETAPPPEREFVDGEIVLYLGRRFRLRTDEAAEAHRARIIGGEYRVTIPEGLIGDARKLAVREQLHDSLMQRAVIYLPGKLGEVARRLDLPAPDLVVRKQDEQWAAYDERGTMLLNWRLIQGNVYGIEAFLAEELGKIYGRADDEMFWIRVRMIWRDFDERLEQLREMGPRFVW
jgi:hypothetical protein